MDLRHATRTYVAAVAARDIAAVAELLAEDFARENPVVQRIEGKAVCLAPSSPVARRWNLLPARSSSTAMSASSSLHSASTPPICKAPTSSPGATGPCPPVPPFQKAEA